MFMGDVNKCTVSDNNSFYFWLYLKPSKNLVFTTEHDTIKIVTLS